MRINRFSRAVKRIAARCRRLRNDELARLVMAMRAAQCHYQHNDDKQQYRKDNRHPPRQTSRSFQLLRNSRHLGHFILLALRGFPAISEYSIRAYTKVFWLPTASILQAPPITCVEMPTMESCARFALAPAFPNAQARKTAVPPHAHQVSRRPSPNAHRVSGSAPVSLRPCTREHGYNVRKYAKSRMRAGTFIVRGASMKSCIRI